MKFNKFISVILVTVMIISSLAGCGGGKDKDNAQEPADASTVADGADSSGKKILRLNNNSEPGSLNPSKAEGTHDSWIIDHCFEGLYRKSKDGGFEKGLADEVTVSEDGKTYTITLKDSKWSNGDPVTAHDFEFTYKNVLNPDFASPYAFYLYVIQNGEEFNNGEKTIDEVGVKAIDDKTLEIQLVAPMPYFDDYFTHYTCLPTNKKVAEENPNWAIKPETYVCNGAFKLTEWVNRASLKIVKNPEYYEADTINLDEVHFIIQEEAVSAWQLYENGELDISYPLPGNIIEKLKEENNPELVLGTDLAVYYYLFNTQKAPFDNVKVRKALAMSIDRNVITDKILKGGQRPAYGLTPRGLTDSKGVDYQESLGDLFNENIEEAKTLLAEGLQEAGVTDFKFTILYNTDDNHKKIAEAIQNMWKQNLGIDVTIENSEFQVVIDRRRNADFEVARAGWIGDYSDPTTFLDLFVTGGEQNSGKWSNQEYDGYVKIMKESANQEERFEVMKKAEKLLMEDMAVMPIYFYTMPYTVKPYVTGIYKPVNRYPQYKYADIVK